jgi:D-alanyl-lipoteichoic acid acyltransferase DltB (MBOAT superfamily)
VFADRGSRTGPPRLTWQATLRMTSGLAGILSGVILLDVHRHLVWPHHNASFTGAVWTGWVSPWVWGALRFVGVYCACSGLANLRIGMMQQLGHRVPDCYHYPLLASNPLDFWGRWNTYVMNWLKRYVFLPLSLSKVLRRRGAVGIGAAVLATFLVSGLVHEMHAYASTLGWGGRFTRQFALLGMVLTCWLAADRLLDAFARGASGKPRSALQIARKITGRVVVIASMLRIPIVWG